jgi:hypothetical protein
LDENKEKNRADQRVVDSLLGKTHLDMMEKLGSFNFNFLLFKELD